MIDTDGWPFEGERPASWDRADEIGRVAMLLARQSINRPKTLPRPGPSPGVRPAHVLPRRPPSSKVGAGRCECGRAARGLLGVAAGAYRYAVPHCGLAAEILLSSAVTMRVLLKDLTVCDR